MLDHSGPQLTSLAGRYATLKLSMKVTHCMEASVSTVPALVATQDLASAWSTSNSSGYIIIATNSH